MSKRIEAPLKVWLVGWGVLAFIALAVPQAVAAGMFLILPGIILVAAPTIFMYSAAFAAIRHFLKMPPTWKRDATALLSSLVLGWVLAQPSAIASRIAFALANLPEVQPAAPVKLAGNIRLELPKDTSNEIKPDPLSTCNPLCAALLDTPGVQGVVLAETGQHGDATSTVFRLVPRGGDRSPSAYPAKPEAILGDLPVEQEAVETRHLDAQRSAQVFDARLAAKKRNAQAVAAAWGLRLASDQKLVAERTVIKADQTIRVTAIRGSEKGISISRVEILDRSGKALMRRSIVVGSALSAPLHFAGVGNMENLHVDEARDRLANAPDYPPLKPIPELFLHSSLARPKVDPDLVRTVVERLRVATGNAALPRTDPDFGLAGLWIPTIDWHHPLPSDQLSVLGLVLADERIPVPPGIYDGATAKVAPELRNALGSRILCASTPHSTRGELAFLLAQLPAGTFAVLTPTEQEFLRKKELWSAVYPMIVRLADMGEAAVPELLEIYGDQTLERETGRESVDDAVALSFAILGPKAHAALPELEAMVRANQARRYTSTDDVKIWNLAFARMGKPIEEFTFPWDKKQEHIAQDRESLRKQVERFNPRNAWVSIY